MAEFAADVTVVGSGIAGLWTAKELVDRGLSVNVLERSDTLADGATTKNEGWLHAGTYHAVSLENEAEIEPVVANTRWSHDAIVSFSPESIDHATTFALALSDDMAQKAVLRWQENGVGFGEVAKGELADAANVDFDRVCAVFKVEDKSVNSRAVCQKLARYVFDHGGNFFTRADFIPNDNGAADMIWGDSKHTLHSDHFVITAGNGMGDVVERITGAELPMRFFKAHLLVTPRLTKDNFFHLEVEEAGLMNHGSASIVGINRDGIEQVVADRSIVPEKRQLIYEALARMVPAILALKTDNNTLMTVACNKPDIVGSIGDIQSLDVKLFEPAHGYTCALPGKMTMAPYLAKKVASLICDQGGLEPSRPSVNTTQLAPVSQRPVDRWQEKANG